MGMSLQQHIRQWASELGFMQTGFARAGFLEEEAPRLEQWLNQHFHGQMHYMANWFDKRLDPRLLVEDAKSVMVLSYNYYPELLQNETVPKISKYAYGEDYHDVIRAKLNELIQRIAEITGPFNGRGFVDSAPVMERAWAQKAGLGWRGKHTLLIDKQAGSFFFLAVLITDLDIPADEAFQSDHCGTCTRCIDTCPTEAIVAPYVLDASKCISYLTIELKEAIPESFRGKMDNWAFGCDVCQDVCPWNRFSKPHQEPRFKPNPLLLSMDKNDWMEITEDIFKQIFSKSAVKRTKWQGFQRNLDFLRETSNQ
jgi:epoxyqueuosine reductase